MYPKLTFSYRIYAHPKLELNLKDNHELFQIQDDYLENNPEVKLEVRWVYENHPMSNDIYVQKWFGRTAFVIYLYNCMYIDYDI
jgi:hypothetical protein